MASQIATQFPTAVFKQAFTITLASLAAAAARQSTLVANKATIGPDSGYPAAMVYLKMKSGAVAPTAGKVYEVYLIRADDTPGSLTFADDNAGTTDAAITIENAPLLGTIIVTANTAKNFYGAFDTAPLGPLGPGWGIAVKNATDQTVDTTGGNFLAEYSMYIPQAQ